MDCKQILAQDRSCKAAVPQHILVMKAEIILALVEVTELRETCAKHTLA